MEPFEIERVIVFNDDDDDDDVDDNDSDDKDGGDDNGKSELRRISSDRSALKVIAASPDEQSDHEQYLKTMQKSTGGNPVKK